MASRRSKREDALMLSMRMFTSFATEITLPRAGYDFSSSLSFHSRM